ncbi:MAG TPA: hypothetical protein VD971_05395 [Phycisphaerales bacterium]|nr:hypothetical protein [Phycisphaerales bacterium]
MRCSLLAAAAVVTSVPAFAAVTGFVSNPSNNSGDFASALAGLGYGVDTSVDFEGHPDGPLSSGLYAGTNGVTLTENAPRGVVHSTGATGGTIAAPVSTGEGLRTGMFGALVGYGVNWSVTATFAGPVAGAGFMTVDYFNPWNDNTMTIAAYDGPDGTGNLLGSYNAAAYCFQLNYTYFLGITSDAADIRSVRISCNGFYGDGLYLDHLAYSVPAPGAAAILGFGAAVMRRRRR